MKNNTLHILMFVFFTLLISCSKDDSGSGEQEVVVVKTKEYKTNLPLEGVNVTLYGCGSYDFELGCVGHTEAKFTSDANGNCSVPRNVYAEMTEKAKLSKSKYWTILYKNTTTEYVLEPEAKVTITIQRLTEYPYNSILELKTRGELGITSTKTIIQRGYSFFDYRIFGNEENQIDWILYDSAYPNGANCRYCNVIASGSFILHPQKFEQLTYTLTY